MFWMSRFWIYEIRMSNISQDYWKKQGPCTTLNGTELEDDSDDNDD